MPETVTITGDDAVARKLEKMGRDALHQEAAMRQSARATVREISGIPVATGRLERSVTVLAANDTGFDVGSRVPYARHVFDGTEHMPARPPKVNADAVARDTAERISRDLND